MTSLQARSAPTSTGSPHKNVRRVAIASYVGTTMEWFDYIAYGTVGALVFNELFFPNLDPLVGTLATFISFGIGFLVRPLGGVIFGHIGDRYGRRLALLITVVMMGLATGALGLMPTYATIGVAAPIVLTVLRVLQGLSVGGEWTGAASLTMESAPASHRARWLSLVQLGSPSGALLSTGLLGLLTTVLSDEQFASWGWRVPFLLAFAMLPVGLYLRLSIEESPEFQRTADEEALPSLPLVTAVRTSWGRMLAAVCAAQVVIGGAYMMLTFVITYGTGTLKLPEQLMLGAVVVGVIVEMVVLVVFAWLADRHGSVRVCVIGGLLTSVLAFPIFALVATGTPALVVVGVALGVGVVSIPYASIGVVMAQLFRPEVRYTGMGVSYNISGALGGFAPALATAMVALSAGQAWGPAVLLMAIGAMTLIGSLASGYLSRKARYL